MCLTDRCVWLMVAGLPAMLLWPTPRTLLAWSGLVVLLVLFDLLAAAPVSRVEVTRTPPSSVRLGESTTATLTLTSASRRRLRLAVRDAWPPSAGASQDRHTLTLAPGARRRLQTVLTPTRRGEREADLVTVRSFGPLRLAGRQRSLTAPSHVRVLPAFVSRRYLPSRLVRLRELDGRAAVMVRGAGTEFDSLREYVIGDDVRSIDWRSTARRGEVVVRTWRPERDRRVIIVLDCGRGAAARLGEETRLDAQIEATLLLAALASRVGDRVDVVAVDERLRSQVTGHTGPTLSAALAEQLAVLQPRLTETNWAAAAGAVRAISAHRATVVVLTALDGSGVDASMIRALGSLARDHTVVVGSALDPALEQMRSAREDSDQAYEAASAERDLLAARMLRDHLARGGVDVVQAPATRLAPAMADEYVALKAAGRL